MVPMGRRLFAGWNPVRTGGPMQVSIEFARAARASRSPIRTRSSAASADEVFTRRGGMYFGIAHLLDYPAPLRQAALPLRRLQRRPLREPQRGAAERDQRRVGHPARARRRPRAPRRRRRQRRGSTESAARALADAPGHRASARSAATSSRATARALERTTLYQRVFALADKARGPTRCRARCCRRSSCTARRSRASSRPPGSPTASTSATGVASRAPDSRQCNCFFRLEDLVVRALHGRLHLRVDAAGAPAGLHGAVADLLQVVDGAHHLAFVRRLAALVRALRAPCGAIRPRTAAGRPGRWRRGSLKGHCPRIARSGSCAAGLGSSASWCSPG